VLLKRYFFVFVLLLSIPAFLSVKGQSSAEAPFSIELPAAVVQYIPAEITIYFPSKVDIPVDTIQMQIGNSVENILLRNGQGVFEQTFDHREELSVSYAEYCATKLVKPIPLWMSILPPLIAIFMALLFREVYTALIVGLIFGSVTIAYFQGFSFFGALFHGLFAVIDVYIIESLNDTGHLSIIVFSLMIGAMVSLISRNGGMKGVVNYLSKFAIGPKSGQFVTWLLGMAIFFDDYANTLIVGNTMRPVTDRLKISREKLSYIVDSTAAPVAALALTTTWIGIELAYIQEGINAIGIDESAYMIFIQSLTTRFYPILTLAFILILIFQGRDFGPMLKAERNAQRGIIDQNKKTAHPAVAVSDDNYTKPRWYNAVIPVIIVVFGTFAGLIVTGWNQEVWMDPGLSSFTKITEIIGDSDSYKALLWASFGGTLAAVIMTVSQKIFNIRKSIDHLIEGFSSMLPAVMILILAWSLALITDYMHTADFLAKVLTGMNLSAQLLPAITFILAAVIAFSTGSSWGTMAILYPLILPVSWMVSQQHGLDYSASLAIFNNVVSSILAGAVFGDHCSPISDTTVLSSLASSCNHIEHVRTQLPYAMLVGFVGIFAGTLPAAYGVPPYILFPVCLIILFLVVRFLGKKTSEVVV